MKYLFISFIAITTFISCTPEPLTIDLDQLEPKLVIGSQIIPNQIMMITVSKSFSALAYDQNNSNDSTANQALLNSLLVSNASVVVSYNGVSDVLYGDPDYPGIYVSLNTPQFINTEYTLNVSDPSTGESVSSTSTMLPLVSFNTIQADSGTTGSLNYIDVEFTISDSPSQDNYYMINVYSSDTLGSSNNNNIFNLQSNIPVQTVLVSDKEYGNGNTINKTERIYDWSTDTIYTTVSNISKSYYDYQVLWQQHGGYSNQLLSEPVNYPSNIIGGYGYFNTHNPTGIIVKVN